MFSLQPRDELVFGSAPSDKYLIPDDPTIADIANFLPKKAKKSQFGIQKISKIERRDHEKSNIMRIIHRDNERQRRLQMAKLHGSLRSLLPLENIRGKRSVSDHMHEAVKYIKLLENNIQELKIRRDSLKKPSRSSTTKIESSNGSDISPNFARVNMIGDGVEILITSNSKNPNFGLSRVLIELQNRVINVVSCVSTRAKEGFLHKIQAQVSDLASLDPSVLQERLTHVIN